MFRKIILTMLTVSLTACGPEGKPPLSVGTSLTTGTNAILRLVQTIPLPNVEGRIDHLSVDIPGQRLFIAALGNNTVEIVDLAAGKVIHSISGLSEPQSVVFISDYNKIFVTNGGDGVCEIFDSDSYASTSRIELAGDADNIRYDRNTQSVYIGYGNGGLSKVDVASGKIIGDIKLDGHPESFQLETSDSRIFVNVPSAKQIAVVDSQKQKVITTLPLKNAAENYPMALNENEHRLFVGFRRPAKMSIYDSETGKLLTSLDSVGDMDDIFYVATHKMILVIGGEGYIDVFSQQAAENYQPIVRIPTASGARTGLWVHELSRLYVAVPHRGIQQAEIQVYELEP